MSELARSHERALFRKVHQVAGRCCRRCPGDRAVLACAKASLETVWAFFEHAQQRLLLPVVDLTFQPIKQLCLLNQKLNECKRAALCFNRHSTKPRKPIRNFILLATSGTPSMESTSSFMCMRLCGFALN